MLEVGIVLQKREYLIDTHFGMEWKLSKIKNLKTKLEF